MTLQDEAPRPRADKRDHEKGESTREMASCIYCRYISDSLLVNDQTSTK